MKKTVYLLLAAVLLVVCTTFDNKLPEERAAEPVVLSDSDSTCGDSLSWTLDDDGVLTISGSGSMYSYNPWSNPAPWAYRAEEIKKIVIGDGVTEINKYAFYSKGYNVGDNYEMEEPQSSVYQNVKSVYIGAAFEEYTTWPGLYSLFAYLTGVEEYVVSEDNLVYSSNDGSIYSKDGGQYLLYPKGLGGSIAIPEGVTTIGVGAFFDAVGLEAVTLPETLKKIDLVAFSYCRSIEELRIPKNLTTIRGIWDNDREDDMQEGEFYECSSLKRFIVDEENPEYMSDDGVLFNKDGSYLYCYPQQHGVEYTIPDGVEVIHDYAFVANNYLQTVNFSDSVHMISYNAFSGCTSLDDVKIPSSVKTLRDYSFHNCESMKNIYISPYTTDISDDAYVFGFVYNETLAVHGDKGSRIEEYVKSVYGDINFIAAEPKISEAEIIEEADGSVTVDVSAEDIMPYHSVYAVSYDENDDLDSYTEVTNGTAKINSTKTKTVKIFVWESLQSLRPICPPVEVSR